MQHTHLVALQSLHRIRGRAVRNGVLGCVLFALLTIPMIKANTYSFVALFQMEHWIKVSVPRTASPYGARVESTM
jgi:hypothetical protein